MSDPVHVLTGLFRDATVRAFGPEHAGIDPALRGSQHADYQANLAMALGKQLKRPPREVAAAIAAAVDAPDVIERLEVAGPGFLNLTVRSSFLARELALAALDPRLGVPLAAPADTVILDYSSPNTAKEMHVGHLRSTIIGDALARVLEALGHTVVRQNHLGDWGTPFGMLIEHLVDLGMDRDGSMSVSDLNGFYKEARAKFDADPAFADRARARVVSLQAGDPRTLELWKGLIEASLRHFRAVYAALGVTLTDRDLAGESMYNALLAPTLAELEQRGLAVPSEGALCVFPPGFTGREGEPLPLIARKQDGGYGYATTDLAAIRYRLEKLHGTRLLYVVGAPQAQHLAMVFAAVRMAGWLAPPARAEHVAFGSILGPDKKMFKTRSGETVRLMDLVDEAVERAAKVVAEKNPDLDPEERAKVARAIGIGAVKYADLSNDRIKDYVFDWDRMLAFEGNTAPYLMYAHARIRSIFRRGGVAPSDTRIVALAAPAERELAKTLLRFGSVVVETGESLQPHRLCGYLYDVASAFATFYEQCPVLKADTDDARLERLALCDVTARVLERGLQLLGLEAPERM